MKKKIYCLVSMVLALAIAGCGEQGGHTSDSSSDSSTSVEESSTSIPSSSYAPITEIDPPTYSEESFQIHYLRYDGLYSGWALWLWKKGQEGSQYAFNGQKQANGGIASYPLSAFSLTATDILGFIVKKTSSWTKDPDGDRFVRLSDYPADANGIHHIYLKQADSSTYCTPDFKMIDSINKAYFSSETRLYFLVSNTMKSYKIYKDGAVIKEVALDHDTTVQTIAVDAVNLTSRYEVEVTFKETGATLRRTVSMSKLYSTSAFDSNYTYSGSDLGLTYGSESSSFKVWSPLSTALTLRVYDSGTPVSVDAVKGSDVHADYVMSKGEKGVWSASVNGNLDGKYYTYLVTNSSYEATEIVDPYATSCGINGLRGFIYDKTTTDPTDWDSVSPYQVDKKSLAIYETHVADLTSSATWTSDSVARAKEKTFLGAALSGTTYTSGSSTVKTGFDHIKELGVNAVQLLPIFDQANDEVNVKFNWGYNPLNYNCVEGAYSSDPYDGRVRVKELKELVKSYHDAGINIIMDVVYNHVNGAAGSNFDVLLPGYFFRYDDDGFLTNGSGCGNETNSEMPMFRKFMIDSTAYWAKEFKLGGFRFDLMGLHDLTTMNQLVANLVTINPKICVLGEPWEMSETPLSTANACTQANGNRWVGFGGFNDKMRDGLIAGGLSGDKDKAWVTNTSASSITDDIVGGIRGHTYGKTNIIDTNKTVNYASCHDNYTLYDRAVAAGVTDQTELHYMPLLANSVVLTSNGTSFFLAGEEFLRTKKAVAEKDEPKDSYSSSYECNELDYSLKTKNSDIFDSYKKLIALKKTVDGLHGENAATVPSAWTINVSPNGNEISYVLPDQSHGKEYKVVHCNGYGTLSDADFGGYSLYLDTRNRSSLSLGSATPMLPFETIIGVKSL
jgi:pullulanase